MGNRNSSTRRKQRENAYTYPENHNIDYTGSKTKSGSTTQRQNQTPAPAYQQPPSGYVANPVTQTTKNYSKANSSKIIC
jgi:hypothetical protein